MTPNLRFKVRIARIERRTPDIAVIDLVPDKRTDVPAFDPGAHVTLRLPNGMERQYSLCSDPDKLWGYRIAVLREVNSRGASKWLHEEAREGDPVFCSYPSNHFPLAAQANRHIMIAGGIGITPFLPMVRQLRQARTDYRLHYCVRDGARAVFADELGPEFEAGLAKLHVSSGQPCSRLNVGALLAEHREGEHLYCCGPERLIKSVMDAAAHWPPETVHVEFFTGLAEDEKFEGDPFEIEVASTGRVIAVPSGRTGLQALREAGLAVPSSCEGGVCRTCVVKILSGDPVHRDRVLKPEERKHEITLCVSRAKGRIRLDL